jgi:hypothetical protein
MIAPHIPVVDKSKREDGTFSREDFSFYKEQNIYICPACKNSPHMHFATQMKGTGGARTGPGQLSRRGLCAGWLHQ